VTGVDFSKQPPEAGLYRFRRRNVARQPFFTQEIVPDSLPANWGYAQALRACWRRTDKAHNDPSAANVLC